MTMTVIEAAVSILVEMTTRLFQQAETIRLIR